MKKTPFLEFQGVAGTYFNKQWLPLSVTDGLNWFLLSARMCMGYHLYPPRFMHTHTDKHIGLWGINGSPGSLWRTRTCGAVIKLRMLRVRSASSQSHYSLPLLHSTTRGAALSAPSTLLRSPLGPTVPSSMKIITQCLSYFQLGVWWGLWDNSETITQPQPPFTMWILGDWYFGHNFFRAQTSTNCVLRWILQTLDSMYIMVAKWVECPSPVLEDRGIRKVAGSSSDPAASISGRVKPMTLKLILVTP